MKEEIMRLPSIPLITHDPFFSVWDPNFTPSGGDTRHWCGTEKRLQGGIQIDGKRLRWMGTGGNPAIPLKAVEITPLSTRYRFEANGVSFTVRFTSPLLMDDLDILSTPITYVHFQVDFIDGKDHTVSILLSGDDTLVYSGERSPKLRSDDFTDGVLNYAYLGQAKQNPLSGSGDHLTIDWGYLFFAASDGKVQNHPASITNALLFSVKKSVPFETTLMIGYDDVASINDFGALLPGYWARDGKTIIEAFREFHEREQEILARCDAFDKKLLSDAREMGGEDYALLVSASYRQSVSAHKLVQDRKGQILFISKENDSNGCAATVDITYPSSPLYLLYCPELVRGMLRPIFKFARMPVWTYDFAPHDAGRYPVMNGQIYGAFFRNKFHANGDTVAPYYLYPSTVEAYRLAGQMPVEECGNMILMVYAASYADGNWELAKENLDLLRKWSRYLIEFGTDPGEQLCTDDFAGHLAHNVNLSAKAMMGVAAYSKILEALGETAEAEEMWATAKAMVESWLERADLGTHSSLSFDGTGWSQKYNLVWDKVFSWHLLPDEFYEKELKSYLPRINEFGLPLDSRASYTKSDWTMWVASMTEDRTVFDALCAPLAHYLRERRSPVPFSDFYDTVDGTYVRFVARSVQGGIFMPLLRKAWSQ